MTAEGRFFHRGCFRCEYCGTTLRLGGYAFVRDTILGPIFFCTSHASMAFLMRTKFLTGKAPPAATAAASASVVAAAASAAAAAAAAAAGSPTPPPAIKVRFASRFILLDLAPFDL